MSIDIGHGVTLSRIGHYKGCIQDGVAGYIEEHRNQEGDPCYGSMFACKECAPDGRPVWETNGEPIESLTLSPSILCRACGNHGWIRDGKWVPA